MAAIGSACRFGTRYIGSAGSGRRIAEFRSTYTTVMKRLHLFEFNELPWLPAFFSAMITDYLRAVFNMVQPFSPQLPLIAQALRRANNGDAVVDLCSGSGGPWEHLSPQLNRLTRRTVPVLLTDKYPNRQTATRADPSTVTWHSQAVDATDVPKSLTGMRTLFNGLHQFDPDMAAAILRSAVDNGESIVAMELLQRSYRDVLMAFLTPLMVWYVAPRIRPFSWARLILTYLVPVAPLIILWDTLVSVLRCYTPGELQAMGQRVSGDRYTWFADCYRHRGAPVTFLIGYPRDPAGPGTPT